MKTFLAALIFASGMQAAAISANVVLNGGGFLQTGSVTNTSVTDIMTGFIYTLGTAGNGVATWDTGTAGGTASDFLSDPEWFQTVTFSGLSIAPGATFNFSGLDIDLIAVLSPLSIDQGTIDNTGSTLSHASVTALFGARSASAPLLQTGWTQSQTLLLSETGDGGRVPEPSTLLLMGAGLLGVFAVKKKRQALK